MELEFAPRLNVLTGDNGLGKSFILDIAWWALTLTWPGERAWPRKEKDADPSISFRHSSGNGRPGWVQAQYDFANQTWDPVEYALNPPDPGLML
jgi:predicted ATP-binding protein involved in virulence